MKRLLFIIPLILALSCGQNDTNKTVSKVSLAFAPIVTTDSSSSTTSSVKITNNKDTVFTNSRTTTIVTTTIHPYIADTTIPPVSISFNVDTIPFSDPEVYSYYRGMNNFYGNQAFQYPANYNYFRLSWAAVQTDVNNYNWPVIDNYIKAAINSGQQVGFRYGAVDVSATSGTISVGGASACYPLFVHNNMQSESVKDWIYTNPQNNTTWWLPNWNSESFLSAWETFIKAVQQHVDTNFPNVTYSVDVGGYGNYLAEWHMYNIDQKSHGTVPTDASLKRMMDAHKVFNCWLLNNIDMFDPKNVSPAFSYYALTSSNSKGLYGLRSDHLADIGTFNYDTIVANVTYNGINFKNTIKLRYQFAPVSGEPMNSVSNVTPPNGTPYQNLGSQMKWYGGSQFSNVSSSTTSAAQSNFIAASKASGYRLQVNGGSYGSSNAVLNLILNWVNNGSAPLYSDYVVNFELRNGSTVAWSGKSSFNPKLFLPGKISITDNYIGLPVGTYSLYMIVKSVNNITKPLSLANKNKGSDGSYFLSSITIK